MDRTELRSSGKTAVPIAQTRKSVMMAVEEPRMAFADRQIAIIYLLLATSQGSISLNKVGAAGVVRLGATAGQARKG